MNFDVNMLSTLMQMLNAQKPRETGPAYASSSENDIAAAQSVSTQKNQSLFAQQNGLGQQIDLAPKQSDHKQTPPQTNPMSSIFDMLGGKNNGGGDAMSNLMPLFMNMMGAKSAQNAQVAQNNMSKNKPDNQQSFEQKLKAAKDKAETNLNDQPEDKSDVQIKNKQSNCIKTISKDKTNAGRDRYEPITFAGYALISSLNKLYINKNSESQSIARQSYRQ